MYTPSPRQLEAINKAFTYASPHAGQPERYVRLRAAAMDFAGLLVTNCPESRELSLAMTNLEQTIMWANASIARNEVPPSPQE